uniref:Uncharacterized protein n=1 Tax=Rhizophora mucronata TaxID=61149 RepID=A0A2P2IS66_RHIMU
MKHDTKRRTCYLRRLVQSRGAPQE